MLPHTTQHPRPKLHLAGISGRQLIEQQAADRVPARPALAGAAGTVTCRQAWMRRLAPPGAGARSWSTPAEPPPVPLGRVPAQPVPPAQLPQSCPAPPPRATAPQPAPRPAAGTLAADSGQEERRRPTARLGRGRGVRGPPRSRPKICPHPLQLRRREALGGHGRQGELVGGQRRRSTLPPQERRQQLEPVAGGRRRHSAPCPSIAGGSGGVAGQGWPAGVSVKASSLLGRTPQREKERKKGRIH